eukprot:SAG25_NODE_11960_length_291_cov_0.755208_1_plen_20_part_10
MVIARVDPLLVSAASRRVAR